MKKMSLFTLAIVLLLIAVSCRELLSEKSDLKLATPATVEDNQALIDQFGFMNVDFASVGETSADDFYMTDADYDGLYYEQDKRLYTWMPDHVTRPSSAGNAWSRCYRAIYISNSVLHNLETYHLTGAKADHIRGQALALRAARYLDASQIWCPAYRQSSASGDLGLPLRLDPDMNAPTVRSTVQQTYDQILSDLHAALPLLPDQQLAKTRMSKTAVHGLLARTYLFMGNYDKALFHSKQALLLQPGLMDFNTINPNAEYPIANLNKEITFWSGMSYEYHLIPAKIPQSIYSSYAVNDLRRTVYFTTDAGNQILFKGYYNNENGPSTGVAVDELYLMAAECYARLNQISEAMSHLNQLLVTRWKTGTYIPFTAANKEEALAIVLAERRKELLIRGLRWADLKRYNRDGANITLTRTVNGKQFVLPPNDPRYAIALPEEIVEITGIPQNPR